MAGVARTALDVGGDAGSGVDAVCHSAQVVEYLVVKGRDWRWVDGSEDFEIGAAGAGGSGVGGAGACGIAAATAAASGVGGVGDVGTAANTAASLVFGACGAPGICLIKMAFQPGEGQGNGLVGVHPDINRGACRLGNDVHCLAASKLGNGVGCTHHCRGLRAALHNRQHQGPEQPEVGKDQLQAKAAMGGQLSEHQLDRLGNPGRRRVSYYAIKRLN